jgi:hypothetical protein
MDEMGEMDGMDGMDAGRDRRVEAGCVLLVGSFG